MSRKYILFVSLAAIAGIGFYLATRGPLTLHQPSIVRKPDLAAATVNLPLTLPAEASAALTLDQQIGANEDAIAKGKQILDEGHWIDRLNHEQLTDNERELTYNMVEHLAHLRSHNIDLRLRRLQARLEGPAR